LALVQSVDNLGKMVGANGVTLTGGEPFLQRNVDLGEFVFRMRQLGYGVEAFSNGTIEYPDWAYNQVHFIMDWKLPGSGEDHLDKIRIANLEKLKHSNHKQAVKFVCKDEDDFMTAVSLWSMYLEGAPHIVTYYGKVWDGDITDAHLADLVMTNQLPWMMNVQLHNYIWDPQERGR
jgi:7-carboxy-7-deazaguanine synthase